MKHACSYGLCLGCWFLLVPVLLADSFGTARIASSYGLVRLFQSSAAISVPPVAVYQEGRSHPGRRLASPRAAGGGGSYGLVRLFQSSAAISVPPVAGLVRDVTGGYSWCFYGMGSCMVLGTIPVIAFHICSKKEEEENSTAD
ncbi:unnamed protein product [Plutella xylostella]|uniref:(diamondback moth) hypothetical protein n=1 Tax=Plutella xylostella TaxID=51655 RepID=A0A8S4G906_PLUXY|nr:unnamed protein product [Plutella xylostella]